MRILIFLALAASAVVALNQDLQGKVAHQREASAASYNLPSRRLASAGGCFGLCRTSSIGRQDSGRRDSGSQSLGRQNSGGRGSFRGDETVINPLTASQKARKKQRIQQSNDNFRAKLNHGRGSQEAPEGRQ
ncbi:hypothetical protein LEN26_003701 [Aphanomyces euteiches]|nr:hypothetical protein AeMF1_007349 [Aphanomyces euteiches]KAH9152495.1 hypothetical protein LEN26_003701 [Aphanomyces euteiches]KAH9181647.1 hypothetical protein AeNC1_016377 [Aphanomyces euteiches]